MNRKRIEKDLVACMNHLHGRLWEEVPNYKPLVSKVIMSGEVNRFFVDAGIDPLDDKINPLACQMLVSWGYVPADYFLSLVDKNNLRDILNHRVQEYNYDYLNIERIGDCDNIKYNLVIPVKENFADVGGRRKNQRLYHSLALATYAHEILKDKKDWCVTFVVQEPKDKPVIKDELKKFFKEKKWVNTNIFVFDSDAEYMKKSACYNYVCKEVNSEWIINHDVDLVFTDEFIKGIEEFCDSGRGCFYQPYYGGSVRQLNDIETTEIIQSALNSNCVNLKKFLDWDKKVEEVKAPGGSIVVKRELMKKVGGYDPQIIEGYGPEDSMFWAKLEVATGEPDYTGFYSPHIGFGFYAENIESQVFHFEHPPGKIDYHNSLIPLTYFKFWTHAEPQTKLEYLKLLDGKL